MILKNIKDYVKKLKIQLYERVKKLTQKPKLAIIVVGDNEASARYVRNKVADCHEIGIETGVYTYPEDIVEFDLMTELKDIQEHYDGVIVQLPLPPHIRSSEVIKAIDDNKDVDGFKVSSPFNPATPKGIMDYLNYCDWDPCGKDVTIVGRSEIVGKPLAHMMLAANATVTLCHSKSDVWKHVRQADLVICAVGKEKFLNCYSIHVPVIDVGINFDENGKLVGDCYNTDDRDVTPVPGGVGLLTRCALLDNVVSACEGREGR